MANTQGNGASSSNTNIIIAVVCGVVAAVAVVILVPIIIRMQQVSEEWQPLVPYLIVNFCSGDTLILNPVQFLLSWGTDKCL